MPNFWVSTVFWIHNLTCGFCTLFWRLPPCSRRWSSCWSDTGHQTASIPPWPRVEGSWTAWCSTKGNFHCFSNTKECKNLYLTCVKSSTRRVADMMTSLRGSPSACLLGTIRERNPMRMSVKTDRSWASSMTMAEYLVNRKSRSISRSNTPSVMNLTRVLSVTVPSNRI